MGTNYKGSEQEVTALNSYLKLIRAADSVSSRVYSSLSKYNLSESQLALLDALFHLGPLTQKVLGKKLLKSGGNITLVIDNLEKHKLVERKRNLNDRRLITIHLTKRGRDILKVVIPEQVKAITEEMSVLTAKDQQKLQKMLKVIGLKKK